MAVSGIALAGCQGENAAEPEKKTSASADWPFRGPNHDGIFKTDFDPAEEPKQIWQANVGAGHSSCVIANGRLFTIGDSHLICLSAESGEEVWRTKVANTYGAPTVVDGKVFTLGEVHPIAACFSAETGETVWTRQLPKASCGKDYFHCAPPLIWHDLVILNSGGGVALNRETGQIAWAHEGIGGMGMPVVCKVSGETAVALFGGEACIFRNPKTGEQHRHVPWEPSEPTAAADPLIFGNHVFLSGGYGAGRALFHLSKPIPSELWAILGVEEGHIWASAVRWNGEIFGFTKTALICVDPASGEAKWEREGLAGSLTILGNHALILTEKGELHIGSISGEGFETRQITQLSGGKTWSLPAYSGGKLFVRNDKGEVSCWRIEN